MRHAIYLSNGNLADSAIIKGICDAGFSMHHTHSISETLHALGNGHKNPGLLVAEIQAGALPLLTLLKEQGKGVPATLVFDREGSDIHAPIKALQLGVKDYLLAKDSTVQRELRARVIAENALHSEPIGEAVVNEPEEETSVFVSTENNNESLNFTWDSVAHIIHVGNEFVRLSPIEGRMFNLLVINRRNAVSMKELIGKALLKPNMTIEEGIKLLRPHLVRLRNKLDAHPILAHRIVNMRGTGYMFV